MRAKDYAKQFDAKPDIDTLMAILNAFLGECATLADARRIQTEAAALAIFDEQDQKWRAFSRLCPAVHPGGFCMALEETIPGELFRRWQQNRMRQN